MIATLTGMGLSAAAGLNAWIPFLVVALAARFTDLVQLPEQFQWIDSWWAIGAAAVLLLVEMTLDKVPAVDSINDAVQTVIRPTVGGLIFAATTAASRLDESTWMQEHSWVGIVLGVVVSALVHGTKAAARPAVNMSTAGFGAPVVSAAEDGASFGLSLAAIFAPLIVVVLLVLLVWGLVWLWRVRRRRRRARQSRAVRL